MKIIKSVIYIVVGLLLSAPFAYDCAYSDPHPYMSMFSFFSLILFLFGCPTLFYGLGKLFIKGEGNSNSQAELDIGRIRYIIEKDSRKQ